MQTTLEMKECANGDGVVRLNLGAGRVAVPGFEAVDRKDGNEVYPLPNADESVDEILASHVLEHFSHLEVSDVLKHWIAKLRPGGRIRLAVPDFEAVAREYMAGMPINVQGYVMGGHQDANDHHGCIFDRESLTEIMILCGLERISAWKSEYVGCSALPISLNLQGFKPSGPANELHGVRAVMSAPRFGPVLHFACHSKAFMQLKIDCQVGQSCFWHQKLSNEMEAAIANPATEYVLTLDFDTVFCATDVMELYRLMKALPEADAIFPLQAKRGCQEALFSFARDGKICGSIPASFLERQLLPANTGHFGLTMFRAESLRKFSRPWMVPKPNDDGLWDNGHVDADIDFWARFQAAGFKPYLAPRVVVGHMQEVVTWPGRDLKPIHQMTGDYSANGIPAEVMR